MQPRSGGAAPAPRLRSHRRRRRLETRERVEAGGGFREEPAERSGGALQRGIGFVLVSGGLQPSGDYFLIVV
jgi:hypothetical protein